MDKNVVMVVANNHDGFTIINNGNEYSMTFVPSPEDGLGTECVADFIFKNGEDEDIVLNNVLCGAPVTFLDILFYFKRQYSITMKNTLPSFTSYERGKILDVKFESGADLSITVPEDSHYTQFLGTNSCYIFKDVDLPDNMKDTGIGDLVNCIYSSKSGRYKLLVDYSCGEAFVLDRMDNVISNAKFRRNIYDIIDALFIDYGKVNYIRQDLGNVEDIITDIKKDYEDSDLFAIRVDMLNENDVVDKIICIYPVPYLVTLDELYVFTEETKLYRSIEYNLNDDNELEVTAETYCVLDADGERQLYKDWIELLEKMDAENL